MKKLINSLLFALLATTAAGSMAAGGNVHLDKAPIDLRNAESLQRGAQTFVNYCLSCHGAGAMRYNRLKDIGLTEAQIKDNLMFTTDKPVSVALFSGSMLEVERIPILHPTRSRSSAPHSLL